MCENPSTPPKKKLAQGVVHTLALAAAPHHTVADQFERRTVPAVAAAPHCTGAQFSQRRGVPALNATSHHTGAVF